MGNTLTKQWTATTDDAGAPVLGLQFWHTVGTGRGIVGRFINTRITVIDGDNLPIYQFQCVHPTALEIQVDEKNKVVSTGGKMKNFQQFAMGAMKGFEMALQGLAFRGFDGFKTGDLVKIVMVEERQPTVVGQSPMAVFEVSVKRELSDAAPAPQAAAAVVGGTQIPFDTTKQKPAITDEDIPF